MDPDQIDTLMLQFTEVVREVVHDEMSEWHRRSREPLPLLDVDGVARRLSVSPRTVARLVEEGELDPIWVRGQRRFAIEAVNDFIRSCPGGRSNLRRKPYRRHR